VFVCQLYFVFTNLYWEDVPWSDYTVSYHRVLLQLIENETMGNVLIRAVADGGRLCC